MAPINDSPSLLTYIGHIEGKVSATLSCDNKKLITLGTDDLILQWNTQDMTTRKQIQLSNHKQQVYTCIAYNQQAMMFVIGTQSGFVYTIQENDTSKREIIYKNGNEEAIVCVRFSRCYRYLAIADSQSKAVVYDFGGSKFYRSDAGHQGLCLYSAFMNDNTRLISYGSDGFAMVYRFQPQTINQIQQYQKFKICHNETLHNQINFSEHPTKQFITFAGTLNLQQLQPAQENSQFYYKLRVQIRQDTEILKTGWLDNNILVLCMENKVTMWNYYTVTKVHSINFTAMVDIICNWQFFGKMYGIGQCGIVYEYNGQTLSKKQEIQTSKHLQEQQRMASMQLNNPWQQPKLQLQTQQPIHQVLKRQKPQQQQTKYELLLVKKPQLGKQTYYQKHLDFQYLFYNQYGCIVRRTDGDCQLYQLQFHDKFKLHKIKLQEQNKLLSYFALTEKCLLYSTLGHVYFQLEYKKYDKDNTTGKVNRVPTLVKWDYIVQDIEGLAIGNQWVCVACKDSLRVFDIAGNQLHTLCFDRIFLAVCAYEDILAVAYNAALPLQACMLFQVKLYKITPHSYKLQKTIKLPVNSGQQLKWLNFSEQGCLYIQDTSDTIRMYIWDKNEWQTIYEQPQSRKYKTYIQHIENYEIYGFRIQQKEGEPTTPTVLPRSLPRKIGFRMPERQYGFLSEDQNKRLHNILVKRLSLLHERFRSSRWLKYKVSRKEQPTTGKSSQRILTEQQLTQSFSQSDITIVQHITKLLPSLQKRIQDRQKLQQAKLQLLSLCRILLFYPQSVHKINSILGAGLSHHMEMFWDQCEKGEYGLKDVSVNRFDRLGRLAMMADFGIGE